MKALLAIFVIALMVCNPVAADVTADSQDVVMTKSFFAIMKGFITGYYKGMYKKTNYKTQDECLGTTMTNNVHALWTEYEQGQFSLTEDLSKVSEIMTYFVKYCEYDEALYDWSRWCYEKESCSFEQMAQALLKKVF
jgi:hypothetical protein